MKDNFDPGLEARSLRFRAEFYRRSGLESEAQRFDAEAEWYEQLAHDEEIGLRRTIRRETGIVHQNLNGLQR